MRKRVSNEIKRRVRQQHGAQVVEFGAALCVLVGFILIPMIDLAVVPIRWMLAQELVNDYTRKLAISETFSDARRRMDADPSLRTRLERLGGVHIQNINLQMRVASIAETSTDKDLICAQPHSIPVQWLPDGGKSPCSYSLELLVEAEISPAIIFRLGDMSVPGLNKPIPVMVHASHVWGNLARNPSTGKFYLNE